MVTNKYLSHPNITFKSRKENCSIKYNESFLSQWSPSLLLIVWSPRGILKSAFTGGGRKKRHVNQREIIKFSGGNKFSCGMNFDNQLNVYADTEVRGPGCLGEICIVGISQPGKANRLWMQCGLVHLGMTWSHQMEKLKELLPLVDN